VRTDAFIGRFGVAVTLACALAVTSTTVALTMPSVRQSLGITPPPPAPSYAVGDTIDVPSEIFSGAPNTLLLFFRSGCGACERMKPFLSKLAARENGTTVRVVAVTGQQNRPSSIKFAQQIGLDVSHLATIDVTKLRLKNVPTWVLVDRSGRIRAALEGIPAQADQDHLLRTVTALSQTH
jgi:thiol-disulfide isomerase/thioredoxin